MFFFNLMNYFGTSCIYYTHLYCILFYHLIDKQSIDDFPCFDLSDVAVQVASKSLMDTLNEMYETQWVGHDHMCTNSNNLDMLWSDYSHKLADQVLIPLNTYQAQFAETRVSDIINIIELNRIKSSPPLTSA